MVVVEQFINNEAAGSEASLGEPVSVIRPGIVGTRVKAILEERGESLAWLGERAGVSTSLLSLLTRGLVQEPRVSTLRKVADALGVDPGELTGMPDWRSGAHSIEGAVFVPIVRLPVRRDGGPERERGEMIPVPKSMLEGRERLLAAIVDGGGMSPHINIGDRVVFDPDATPRDGDVVLVYARGVTLAGWYSNHQWDRVDLADGNWLPLADIQIAGVILHTLSTPPRRPSQPTKGE